MHVPLEHVCEVLQHVGLLVPHTRPVGQQAPPMHEAPPSHVPVGFIELHTGAWHEPLLHDIPVGQHVDPQARSVAQHVPPVQVMPLPQKPLGLEAEHGVTQMPSMHVCDEVQQLREPHTCDVWQHSPSTHDDPEAQLPVGLLALQSFDAHTQSSKALPSDLQVCVPVPPPVQLHVLVSPGMHSDESPAHAAATTASRKRPMTAARDRMRPA